MYTFRVGLKIWMNANPGLTPKNYTIIVAENTSRISGSFVEFCDYKFKDRDGEELTIPGFKMNGFPLPRTIIYSPIYSAEIELPISLLREPEIIREDKINQILK